MGIMDYQLIKAGPDKVVEVHEILKKCGEDMKLRFGFGHWVPPYPLELLRVDAEEKSVYIVLDGGKNIATVTTGEQPPGYYDISLWEAPDEKAIYMNRLAVLPEFQGRGVGAWCMNKVERAAKETGCAAVRLNTIEKHIKLQHFYEKLGYQRKGGIKFRDDKLVCFEKSLPPQ